MAEPPLYAAHRVGRGAVPLLLANDTLSPKGRIEAMDNGRSAKGTLNTTRGNTTRGNTTQGTGAPRNKTTSTRFSACCAPIQEMLWMPLKFYGVDTVLILPSV